MLLLVVLLRGRSQSVETSKLEERKCLVQEEEGEMREVERKNRKKANSSPEFG